MSNDGEEAAVSDIQKPATVGFRPVDAYTPHDQWILVRWRNTTTGQWMLPLVVRGGGSGPLWWDGKREWMQEGDEVQWCHIPPECIADGE